MDNLFEDFSMNDTCTRKTAISAYQSQGLCARDLYNDLGQHEDYNCIELLQTLGY